MKYVYPVCGYDELTEQPYDAAKNSSYEICSCCGYEFGFDDFSEHINFEDYRRQWIAEGAQWFSPDRKRLHWDLKKQLKNIESK